jgi:hypothetical protein
LDRSFGNTKDEPPESTLAKSTTYFDTEDPLKNQFNASMKWILEVSVSLSWEKVEKKEANHYFFCNFKVKNIRIFYLHYHIHHYGLQQLSEVHLG